MKATGDDGDIAATLRAFVGPHVDSFDYMIESGLAAAVLNLGYQEATVGGATVRVWLEAPRVGSPSKADLAGRKCDGRLFPAECRERGLNYAAALNVIVRVRVEDGRGVVLADHSVDRCLGAIPIMVRSRRCHLRDLGRARLARRHEDELEMGGYFICNGIERVVRMLQVPRRNHPMAVERPSYTKRGPMFTAKAVSIRSVRPDDQSGITLTLHYLRDGNAAACFAIRKAQYYMPIMLLLRALKDTTDKEIFTKVLCGDTANTFVSDRLQLLLLSFKRRHALESRGGFRGTRDACRRYLGKRFRVVLEAPPTMDDFEVGTLLLDRFCFVHLNPLGGRGTGACGTCAGAGTGAATGAGAGAGAGTGAGSASRGSASRSGASRSSASWSSDGRQVAAATAPCTDASGSSRASAARTWSPNAASADADKFELALLLLRKLFAFEQGLCAADDADAVSNQEILVGGHLLNMLLKERLGEYLRQVKLQLLKDSRAQHRNHGPTHARAHKKSRTVANSSMDPKDDKYIGRVLDRQGDIGNKLFYFLATGNLVSPTGLNLMQVSGFTIVAEKLNRLRYLSHFRSVHRGQFFAEMKTTSVRKLRPEAWGFLCPVHTPDGSPCGLLNHLAAHTKVVAKPLSDPRTSHTLLPAVLVTLGMRPAVGHSAASLVGSDALPVLLDGRVVGTVSAAAAHPLAACLRRLKIAGKRHVPRSLEIVYIPFVRGGGGSFPGIYLATAPARMLRCVRHINSGLTESIGPMEQVYLHVACTPDDVCAGLTTHAEINATEMLSMVAALTPFSDFNQSPRNMYQCQMGKQTMGTPAHNFPHRTDNKIYRLQTPEIPVMQTSTQREYCIDDHPNGTNAVVCVISYTGYDMEDAMIVNKSSYDRGFAHASVYKTVSVDLRDANRGRQVGAREVFGFSHASKQDAACSLDVDGLVPVGRLVRYGDPLASIFDQVSGKTRTIKHKEAVPAYVEEVRLVSADGPARQGRRGDSTAGPMGTARDRRFVCANENLQVVRFKLRFCRNPVVGDKFSSRHGQKGVMSILWPQEDMPFTEHGLTPDIIINPHAFPSRMTIGMLIESMAGKGACLHGRLRDATPFKFVENRQAVAEFGHHLKARRLPRTHARRARTHGANGANARMSAHAVTHAYSHILTYFPLNVI